MFLLQRSVLSSKGNHHLPTVQARKRMPSLIPSSSLNLTRKALSPGYSTTKTSWIHSLFYSFDTTSEHSSVSFALITAIVTLFGSFWVPFSPFSQFPPLWPDWYLLSEFLSKPFFCFPSLGYISVFLMMPRRPCRTWSYLVTCILSTLQP